MNVLIQYPNKKTALFWSFLLPFAFLFGEKIHANCGFAVQGTVTQNAGCGAANGSAELVLLGGVAPLTFLWSNGTTNSTATGLTAGAYSVSITDATSCVSVARVEVSNLASPTISNMNASNASCQNSNGSASFTIAGTGSNYNLAWSGASSGTQNSPSLASINNLPAGFYNLTVTDAAGCRRVSNFTVPQSGAISSLSTIIQQPNCSGGTNGILRLTATAGSLPFEFFINGVSGGIVFSNNFDFSNLSTGVYDLQVRDGSGCVSNILTVGLSEIGSIPLSTTDFTFASATCPSVGNGAVVENIISGNAYQIFNRQNGALLGGLPQNTLMAGQYEIRFNNGGCISRLPFVVNEPRAWSAEMQITNSTCTAGQADVAMTLTGSTANSTAPFYSYAWSNGANSRDLTNVFPDFYSLTVTDARGCTFVIDTVNVPNCSDSDSITILTGATAIFCVDTNDIAGSVFTVLNLCTGSNDNGIINSIATDGCINYTAGAIMGVDTICVQVCNAAGNSCDTTTIFVFVQSPVDTFRTTVLTTQNTILCPNISSFVNPIISAINLNCRNADNGTVIGVNNATGCVNYTAGNTMGFDTVCVRICDAQGFCDTSILIFRVQSPIDTTIFNVSATTEGTFCPQLIPFANLINSANGLNCAVLNGGIINGINAGNGCTRYQAGNIAGRDTFCLEVCDNQGFCDTTIVVFNVVPRPDTVRIDILPGANAVDTCLYNIQFAGVQTSVTDLGCDQNTVGTVTINSITGCVNYAPPIPSPGSGNRADTVCLQICDNSNPAYCDTVIYIFNNLEPICGGAVPDNLSYQVQDCATAVTVCLPIPLDSINDYDVLINSSIYNGGFSGCAFITRVQYPVVLVPFCNNDFIISWVVNGQTFGPVQVTGFAGVVNQLNAWDTVTVFGLSPNNTVITGVNNGNDGISYGNLTIACIGGGSPTVLGATTQQQYADGSNISLAGVGNYQLTVIDQFGCVDTSLIRVVCVQSNTIIDTVLLDSITINCNVDISQITAMDTIFNACAGAGLVSVAIDAVTNCLSFTGLALGQDSVCIVVCDTFGICDTTYFIINVLLPAPVAVRDVDTLAFATNSLIINVCNNDTIPNAPFTLSLITQPTLGAFTGGPCTWTYTRRDAQTCGIDSFQYQITNIGGIDSAWVVVDIECLPFSISGGISPNGDGLNDKFIINNLQDYPNHQIFIYNRWGNLIFRAKNYQNDWAGTFNGQDLPDGVYYYIIELNDAISQVFNGYVILQR
jgi:gliding motility-associated-like protein